MNDEVEPKDTGLADQVHRTLQCSGIDYYSCEEAIKRLNDYLDHQLTEEERTVVVKHLEICKPCLSRFSFEEDLIVSIRKRICGMAAPQGIKDKLKSLLRKPGSE